MASTAIRERRRTLRYRNLLVRQMVQMKNKISGLLMEAGVNYNKQRLHKAGYFRELLATNPDIDEGLCGLLRVCRETVVRLQKTESAVVRSLERDALLVERVERLMSIPAVGPITALTWALEIGDVQRFSSIKKAISYCGLCGAEKSSRNTVQRTPLSKQRNKHLQTTLIEAAKMAPRNSADLAMLPKHGRAEHRSAFKFRGLDRLRAATLCQRERKTELAGSVTALISESRRARPRSSIYNYIDEARKHGRRSRTVEGHRSSVTDESLSCRRNALTAELRAQPLCSVGRQAGS